jgi:hypothetical protein
MIRSRLLTILLSAGLLLATLAFIDTVSSSVNLPGNNQGYEPVQPLNYSHRLHAGELGIDCRYCHFGAERSRNAGVPPTSVCMNCHGFISAPSAAVRAENERATKDGSTPRRVIAPALRPLYASAGWNDEMKPDPSIAAQSIEWVRVHNLPDFVYFDHRPHVNAGVQCQQCHGEVQTMERVRQVGDLSMGWCVNCHRESNAIGVGGRKVHAPIDCVACHY